MLPNNSGVLGLGLLVQVVDGALTPATDYYHQGSVIERKMSLDHKLREIKMLPPKKCCSWDRDIYLEYYLPYVTYAVLLDTAVPKNPYCKADTKYISNKDEVYSLK